MLQEKQGTMEKPLDEKEKIQKSGLKKDIDEIMASVREKFLTKDVNGKNVDISTFKGMIEWLKTPPEGLDEKQSILYKKINQASLGYQQDVNKKISSLAQAVWENPKTQNILNKIKTLVEKGFIILDSNLTKIYNKYVQNKKGKLEVEDEKNFLDFLDSIRIKIEDPSETLKRVREELDKLKGNIDVSRATKIIEKFDNYEKVSNLADRRKILTEIKYDLESPFLDTHKEIYNKLKKIYSKLENGYYKDFNKFAKQIRDNNLEIKASENLPLDLSNLEKSNDKKSIKDYIDKIKKDIDKIKKDIDKIKKDKSLPEETIKNFEKVSKKIDIFVKDLSKPETQEEIKEKIKNILLDLKKSLDTDESGYLLKALKLGGISEKINLGQAFVLDENNNPISNFKENQTYVLNSPKQENNSIDLLTILPENIKEIKVNGVIYTRGKKGYFRNTPNSLTEARKLKEVGKDKFFNLSLKSGDSFEVVKIGEINKETKKEELENIGKSLKKDVENIKKSLEKDIKSITKKIQNGENISSPKSNEKVKTINDATERLAGMTDLLSDMTSLSVSGTTSYLEMLMNSIGALLELFTMILGGKSSANTETTTNSGTQGEGGKSVEGNNGETNKTRTNNSQFEYVGVSNSQELQEIRENQNDSLPNNVRIVDGKYIRFEKMNTIPMRGYDLGEYMLKNSGEYLSHHEKYLPEILDIEKKIGVPAEVLINLIYHEDGGADWIPDEYKSGKAFGLGQHYKEAWADAYNLGNKLGIYIPENMLDSNPEDQIKAAALYLKLQHNKTQNWVLATVNYHTGGGYKESYFKSNPAIKEKLGNNEENRKNYQIAAIAYYYDMNFDEAKKIYRTANDPYKRILKNHFKQTEIGIEGFNLKKLDLSGYKNIHFDSKLEKSINGQAVLNPIMQRKLEEALPEIEEILKKKGYKMEIFSGYRDYDYQQGLGSVKVGAHQFGLAIDIHIQKNGKNVGTKKGGRFNSIFIENGPDSEVWKEVASVLQNKGFRWGKSFGDTMHFDYNWINNAQKLKENVNYISGSQREIYKQTMDVIRNNTPE